jgi:hypothetical protein
MIRLIEEFVYWLLETMWPSSWSLRQRASFTIALLILILACWLSFVGWALAHGW